MMLVGALLCVAGIVTVFGGKGEDIVIGLFELIVGAVLSRVGYHAFFDD